MAEPVIVIDSSEIVQARLEDLKKAIRELAAFAEANEPRAIAYDTYLNEDESVMTVIQIHPDSASAEFHMEVAGPIFRQFASFLRLERIDIYGRPSERLMEQMRRKAQMLGGADLVVNELHAGFTRFSALAA